MNKETVELVKQYVVATLDEPNGISEEAYKALIGLLQLDRELAQEMHEVVGNIDNHSGRYFLLEQNEAFEL